MPPLGEKHLHELHSIEEFRTVQQRIHSNIPESHKSLSSADKENLLGSLGDIIDGLESFQAANSDPQVEIELACVRYVRDRLARAWSDDLYIDALR
jgi:hypothetical protein